MWQVRVRVLTFWILLCSVSAAAAQSELAPMPSGQPVAQAVSVEAGPTCLDEHRLQSRLVRWLERERIDSDIRIGVKGGPGDHDFKFTLRRGDAQPTVRVLPSVPGDCGDQHAAVALAIALAIDASLLGPLAAPEPTTVTASTPLQSLPEEAPFTPKLSLSLGGGVGVGFVTDMAPGVFGALHAELFRSVEIRLSGRWTGLFAMPWPGLDVKYDVGLSTGGLSLCPMVRPFQFLSATACGAFSGGVFRTRAQGLRSASVQNSPYWAIGLSLDFRIHITEQFGARVAMELALPLMNRDIVIDDAMGRVADRRELLPASVFLGLAPLLVLF